jgi:hypothetical protein
MSIAIQTKTLYATNHKGTRIVAFTCNGHRITRPFDDRLDDVQAHLSVAVALIIDQFSNPPPATMVYGGTQDGYVFCWPHSSIEVHHAD